MLIVRRSQPRSKVTVITFQKKRRNATRTTFIFPLLPSPSSTPVGASSAYKLTRLLTSSNPCLQSTTMSMSTSSSQAQPPANDGFDWTSLTSPENKARTIQLLTQDRENCSPWVGPGEGQDVRTAAVLIPICYDKEGNPSLLYNLRSQQLSRNSGQISFPGGIIDPEDKFDPVVAALRETHEELGIPSEDIDVWVTLRSLPTVTSNLTVTPVLGFVKRNPLDPASLTVNKDEVDHAFTISLQHLCNPENWEEGKYTNDKGTVHLPIWHNLNVSNGKEEINLWGLTAFISHFVLLALLPPQLYKRKVPYAKLELKPKKKVTKQDVPQEDLGHSSNL